MRPCMLHELAKRRGKELRCQLVLARPGQATVRGSGRPRKRDVERGQARLSVFQIFLALPMSIARPVMAACFGGTQTGTANAGKSCGFGTRGIQLGRAHAGRSDIAAFSHSRSRCYPRGARVSPSPHRPPAARARGQSVHLLIANANPPTRHGRSTIASSIVPFVRLSGPSASAGVRGPRVERAPKPRAWPPKSRPISRRARAQG
jgi:hypothetical protein